MKEGSSVAVIVSRGPPPVAVPDLTGLSEKDAVKALTDAGFDPKPQPQEDEKVPKGTVIEWAPKGTQPKGTAIAVKVSSGPGPRTMTDWKGKDFTEAEAALKKAGLVVKRNDVYSDDVKDVGKVVSTDPGAGQQVPYGGTVTVNVSKGALTISLPDVSGKTVDEATTILEGQGLRVTGAFGPPRGRVYVTNPPAGSQVKRGSSVDLYTRNGGG
jgi:serine/threonine-protein kinase